MRLIRFQLWLTTALAAVLPSLASASLNAWSQGWPEEPQIRQKAEVPEASEAFRKEAEKEASEASEWGGWGLKTASGDFFEETPEYAGHDWPQTQQPRRENGDRDYDTASDVRNGPNVYTYVVQNPWTYFDSLGLFVDEWEASLQFSFGFGSSSGPTFSAGVSLSTNTDLGDSAKLINDVNFRFYGGGQGTRNDFYSTSYDATFSSQVIVGSGQGDGLPIQTLNRQTQSNFENTFDSSIGIGGMVNYNDATSDVTTHHLVSGRTGNVSITYQNDMGYLPGLPLSFGDLVGTDQAWTASATLSTTSLSLGYQQFTGIPDYDFGGGEGTLYPQSYDQEMLNRAEHFLTFPAGNGALTTGFTGPHSGQNAVHLVKDLPSFKNTSDTEITIDKEIKVD